MTISGICGAIGSGKSHTQLKIGLEQANKKQKQLVTNFPLNFPALYRYCRYKKYNWLIYLLHKRAGISWICNAKEMSELLFSESVCLLDEAGVFLNSRAFQTTSKELLSGLSQSRKSGCDLIYCAQFDEQVDKQMRMLTQYWHHCQGLSVFDKKLRRPKLLYKAIYSFDASSYQQWVSSPKARSSSLRTRFAYAFNTETGFLSRADRMLFDCFDSFAKLDNPNFVAYNRDLTKFRGAGNFLGGAIPDSYLSWETPIREGLERDFQQFFV